MLGVIVLGMVLLVFILIGFLNKNSQQSISTEGWKEYTDNQMHFSYKYPPQFSQEKNYGTIHGSGFNYISKDFDMKEGRQLKKEGKYISFSVVYSEASLNEVLPNAKTFSDIKNIISKMDPKRLQIIKSEEVVVGKRPGYLIFWRATNPDQYKSVISGKIYVIVNEKNTVSIGSYMVNTEYDEMMVKGLLSTFRFK